MKRKKKRVLKVKNIVILLGILMVIGGGIYYLLTMPIHNIYIQGNLVVSDDEILSLSALDQYPSFLLTTSASVRKKLKNNLYIEDVLVKKKFGNVMELVIREYPVICVYLDQILLGNGNLVSNQYHLMDVPILSGSIDDEKVMKEFAKKFGLVDVNILRQISEIVYAPASVDKERFLLYMNDGNLVYITLTKISKLNKYNQIKDKLNGANGVLYLDSGDYVELKSVS